MQDNYFKSKLIPFFLAILFCTIGYSQKDTVNFKPYWEMGFCFSPYEVCNLKAQEGFNHKYSNQFAFVLGLNTRFSFTRRSSITTGIEFYNFMYKVNYSWFVNQSGDPNIPLLGNLRGTYVDFPLLYNFKFILKEKFSLYGSGGACYSILNGIKDKTTFANNTIRNSGFATNFILSYQFGLGFEYKNNRGSGIAIEPYYKIFNKGFDKLMYQKPTSFGVKIIVQGKMQWKCFFKRGAWKPFPICD